MHATLLYQHFHIKYTNSFVSNNRCADPRRLIFFVKIFFLQSQDGYIRLLMTRKCNLEMCTFRVIISPNGVSKISCFSATAKNKKGGKTHLVAKKAEKAFLKAVSRIAQFQTGDIFCNRLW